MESLPRAALAASPRRFALGCHAAAFQAGGALIRDELLRRALRAITILLLQLDPARPAMSQSLSKILVHLIFSTKHRQPFLPHEFYEALKTYAYGICKE